MLIEIETAKAMASLIATSDTKDPQLNKVFVEITPERIRAIASDRYILATFSNTNKAELSPAKFVINAQQAKAIMATKSKQNVAISTDLYTTTITLDGITITDDSNVELGDRLISFAAEFAKTDNYDQAMPLNIDLSRLALLTKLLTAEPKPERITNWRVFTAQPSDNESKNPKPIKLVAGNFVAYLQPRKDY